jgi:glutamate-ammonia-ligase adenylyltransferase
MALTRARVVAGPKPLRERVEAEIASALARAGDAAKVRADAAAMRARMGREQPLEGAWDVKHRAGGQIDVEFIAQVLQLTHAAERPEVCSPTTRVALRRLAAVGLLPEEDAALLIRADRLWRTVQGMLRITVGRDAPEALPGASAGPLLRAAAAAGAEAVDLPALRATLDEVAQQVRSLFVRHVGEIGG